jgi:hypothetical protein
MYIVKSSKLISCLVASLASVAVPATAQDRGRGIAEERHVAVPDHDTGGVDGCWRADRLLYGPYRLTFCMDRHGSGRYSIRGGNLYCDAGLSWYADRGTLRVAMQRARCGPFTDWTADRITCHVTYADAHSGHRVAVPSRGELRCVYRPAVPGYPRTDFSAYRT